MKINNIYKLMALMVLFITLQSRSNGPASVANLQVTGAPGSGGNAGTCANSGCHVAGSFDPTASIELLDGTDPVTAYQPGKTYNVKVRIAEGNGSAARYAFQAVALDGSDSQAGSWGNVGSGKQVVALGGRDYVEHSSPSMDGTFEFEWVAPDAGAGDVTFYSAGIASNNNGGTSGDGTASNSLTVTEDPVNSVANLDEKSTSLIVMPNPVDEILNLDIYSTLAGNHQINIVDMSGKVISSTPFDVQVGEQFAQVNVNHLIPGMYIVQLSGNDQTTVAKMLKR